MSKNIHKKKIKDFDDDMIKLLKEKLTIPAQKNDIRLSPFGTVHATVMLTFAEHRGSRSTHTFGFCLITLVMVILLAPNLVTLSIK